MGDGENGHDSERGPLMEVNTGLPYVTEDEMESKAKGSIGSVMAFMLVPRIIGIGIVLLFCLVIMGMDMYDSRLKALNSMGSQSTDLQLGYLYIAIGTISFLVSFLNLFPMYYKEQILPGNAGNLRSNMMIYKVNFVESDLGETPKQLPYVVMEEDGEIGEYNRANRALFHWNENGIAVTMNILAAGLVFSLPVMVLAILYTLARIWYQIAYASGGYGIGCCKHAIPFMVSTILIAPIFEMTVWFAGGRLLWLGYGQ